MGVFKDCGCGCNGRKQQDKFLTSVISGLTFFIVANPETFRLVRRILGPSIATPNGCPSNFGLVVHAIVFTLIVWGMMNVKKEGGKKGCGCKGKRKVIRLSRVHHLIWSMPLTLNPILGNPKSIFTRRVGFWNP